MSRARATGAPDDTVDPASVHDTPHRDPRQRRVLDARRRTSEGAGPGHGSATAECLTEGVDLERCGPDDIEALTAFLGEVDLTRSGLDAASVRLWLAHDGTGVIVGSTGYEISGDGDHALIRSVAVSADQRSRGRGSALATFALARAAEEGARRAWLFSRRSGPFWQSLGFEPADRDELAEVLADTHQVRLFRQTGQLGREVAWSRPLAAGE